VQLPGRVLVLSVVRTRHATEVKFVVSCKLTCCAEHVTLLLYVAVWVCCCSGVDWPAGDQLLPRGARQQDTLCIPCGLDIRTHQSQQVVSSLLQGHPLSGVVGCYTLAVHSAGLVAICGRQQLAACSSWLRWPPVLLAGWRIDMHGSAVSRTVDG
jgi:hypothetical protein